MVFKNYRIMQGFRPVPGVKRENKIPVVRMRNCERGIGFHHKDVPLSRKGKEEKQGQGELGQKGCGTP